MSQQAPAFRTDWSREVLRTRRGLSFYFHEAAGAHGSVATARFPNGVAGPDRHLTVDEVALLTALQSARTLPRALREQLRDCDQVLARLILDGLVEVRRGGRFLSGMAALETADQAAVPEVSGISELALEYALAVRHLKPADLAKRLYSFNSLPRAESQPRDSAAAFAAQTGIGIDSPSPLIGGREWAIQSSPGWLYFRRGTSPGHPFKIYLCPRPEDISRVIPGFAEVLGRARGSVFKVAFPPGSLVRPDKIVAYIPSFAALQKTLAGLVSLALDATAQPVPFSAPVPGAPLFSWGVDPPGQSSSWRSWLTRQVAECAHSIPVATAPADAMGHLKTALQLRDIDPVSWLPRQQLISRKWSLEL